MQFFSSIGLSAQMFWPLLEYRPLFYRLQASTSRLRHPLNKAQLQLLAPLSRFYKYLLPALVSALQKARPSWRLKGGLFMGFYRPQGDVFRGLTALAWALALSIFFTGSSLLAIGPASSLQHWFWQSLNCVITNWPPLDQCAVHVPRIFHVLWNEKTNKFRIWLAIDFKCI